LKNFTLQNLYEKISDRIRRIALDCAHRSGSGDNLSRSKSHRFAGVVRCRYSGNGND
jgi:hypothetical protein